MNNETEKISTQVENNSEPKRPIFINPPPQDRWCDCCGRHISELQPFDKTHGDRFEGAYLVKIFRREAPYNEEAEKAVDEAEYHCREKGSPREWMVAKYGKRKGELLFVLGQGSSTIGSSKICRDCILFSEDEFFEKLYSRLSNDRAKKDQIDKENNAVMGGQ